MYRLIDEVAASHDPLLIAGKRGKAVLLSETDWNAIQETLHLLSIPGMRDSICEGMDTPVDGCDEKLVGDLKGAYSRRIDIQHRLVSEVLEEQRVVKVLGLWAHYE